MSLDTESFKPSERAVDAGAKRDQGDLSRQVWSGAGGDKAKSDGKKTDGHGQLDLSVGSLYKSVHAQDVPAMAANVLKGDFPKMITETAVRVVREGGLNQVLPLIAAEQFFAPGLKGVSQAEQGLQAALRQLALGQASSGRRTEHASTPGKRPEQVAHAPGKEPQSVKSGSPHDGHGARLAGAGAAAKGAAGASKPGHASSDGAGDAKSTKQSVDPEKIDKLAESLHKESGADSTVKALSHTDREKVFELLKGTTEGERKALQDKYKDKYKQSLDKEYDFLSGSDKDKFNALLNKKDGDVGGQGADRIKAALDESDEVTGRSKEKCAQDIRDTLATMNSKQIEEAKKSYHEKYNKDGKGLDLPDAIKKDSAVPQATKDAIDIYMKGVDKRTDKDTLALADISLKDKNITMFQEAMTQASPEARQAFIKNGGDDKMKDAFAGHWYNAIVRGEKGSDANITDKELERAQDLVKHGKESTAQQVKDNTGYLSNNTEAIDQSLARMTDDERKSYTRGKELTEKNEEPKDESDKKALSYYQELHDSLNKVNLYTHDANMARWEDMIVHKDGGMIAKVGAHRGSLYNDSASAVTRDIEGMDKGEWQRLHNLRNGKNADGSEAKSDADKKHNVEEYRHHQDELKKALNGLNGGRIGDDDIKKMTDMFDKKMEANTFEDSQKVRRLFEQTINDDTHWYSNDRRALLDDIAHMSKEEQAKYRDDPAFKSKVDDLVRGNTGIFKAGPGREGAEHMLDNIAAGKAPEDALAKMYMHSQERLEGDAKKNSAANMLAVPTGGLSLVFNAGDSLAGNRGQAALVGSSSADAVRDLQDAFKKDPGLRERILHPKSDADKEFSEKFYAATKSAMSGSDFDNYAKPLIETGNLTIEQQMDMNKGLISNDKPGAFKDILTATPEEKQRVLTDAAYQEKVLGFLSKDDRAVAINALKQGKMAPEDEIRSHLNHVGGSEEIMHTLRSLPPNEIERVRHEYNRKYGTDLEASLIDKLGSDKRPEMERMFQKHANATEAYNDARDEYYKTRDGFGSKFVDGVNSGTGHQLDDVMHQYGKEVAEAHKHYQEMSPTKQKEMHEQFAASIKNFRESKEAAADYTVDAAIAAGAIGGMIATGGASTPLVVGLAAAGAAAKVGGKAAILGADYDLTMSQIGLDAVSGAASGATAVLGPGEIAGAFKVGEKAAEQAAKATIKEIGEQAAKKVAAEALEAGAKTAVEAGAKTVLKEGGEQVIQDGAKQIMKDALAHGAKELDEKAIQALAEKAVANELIGDARKQAVKEVAEGLKQNLERSFKEETASWLKNMAREGALNAGAGAAGGGISGGIEGASQWDGSKSFAKNMSQLGETMAMSAASGAGGALAMTGVMKGVGAAWSGLHGRTVEVLPRENSGMLPHSEIRRPAPDNLFFDNGTSMTRRASAGADGAETWWVHGPNGEAKVFRGTVEHTGDGQVVMKAHASGSTVVLNPDGSVARHIPGDAINSHGAPEHASKSTDTIDRKRFHSQNASERGYLPPHTDTPVLEPVESIRESAATPPMDAAARGDMLGNDGIKFLSDRGGTSFMVKSSDDVGRAIRKELGEETFQKVEFLLKGDAASRSQIERLRSSIAERSGHHYTDVDSLMGNVRGVLKDNGMELGHLSSDAQRDALEGVLLVQLMPDEVPLYRSTEFKGEAGKDGMSWWGLGENGMAVASNYVTSDRALMKSTLGELRQVGALRSDTVAMTGNALELYHHELPEGGYRPYKGVEIQPLRMDLNSNGLSSEHAKQVASALKGRELNSLSVHERKQLINHLTKDFGWSTLDLEQAFGQQALRGLGYGQKINLNLPFSESPSVTVSDGHRLPAEATSHDSTAKLRTPERLVQDGLWQPERELGALGTERAAQIENEIGSTHASSFLEPDAINEFNDRVLSVTEKSDARLQSKFFELNSIEGELAKSQRQAEKRVLDSGLISPSEFDTPNVARQKLAGKPEALESYNRYVQAKDDYQAASSKLKPELDKRVEELQKQVDQFLLKRNRPPVKLVVDDSIAAAAAGAMYDSGKIKLGSGLLDFDRNGDKLVDNLFHELIHSEQQDLVLRKLADERHIGIQYNEQDLRHVQKAYESLGDNIDQEHIKAVLDNRKGRPLGESELKRAGEMENAFRKNCPPGPEYEREAADFLKGKQILEKLNGPDFAEYCKQLTEKLNGPDGAILSERLFGSEPSGQLKALLEQSAKDATSTNRDAPEIYKQLIIRRMNEINHKRQVAYDAYMNGNHEKEAWYGGQKAKALAHSRRTNAISGGTFSPESDFSDI